MKKSILSLKLIFILILSAYVHFNCSKLDENPTSFVSPQNYFNTVSQAESILIGVSNELWQVWNKYSYGWGFFVHDDQLDGGNLNIGYNHGEELWQAHWTCILNLNTLLKAIDADRIKNTTQGDIDLLMGQAKFLRAHNYFMLVRLYGGLPIYTNENEDPIVNPLPRSSIAEVYKLIISDFTDAIAKLPVQWPVSKKGRPSKGAAQGLLSKVYLTMATAPLNDVSYYGKAAAMAKEVIVGGAHSLITNANEVFLLSNKYSSEMMWSYNSTYDDLSTDSQIWAPWEMGGWQDFMVDPDWAALWPEQPRKNNYLLTELNGIYYTEWAGRKPAVGKFLPPNIPEDDLENYSATYNLPIIRYADVLLIFAEATNMANGGPTQEACDAVNKVVDRANGYVSNPLHPRFTTSLSKEQFDKKIIDERNWELCFEYDRWFDLIRKRILGEKNPRYAVNFSDADYLFPIPEKDLRLNKLLEQNPGYPTPER